MPKSYYPTLFEQSDRDSWKDHLDKRGFVVIKDILNHSSVETSLNQFKSDWKTVAPDFSFTDVETWKVKNTPIMWSKGMCVFSGLPQSDFMWGLRLNSNIQTVFKHVYDTNELVCSLDGMSVFLDTTHKSKSWLHVDQNPKNTIYSIQGAINMLPVKSNKDAGFILVPDSHNTYKPVVNHKKDWIVCDDQEAVIKTAKKLILPANCLTLWDSRLIHANDGNKYSKQEYSTILEEKGSTSGLHDTKYLNRLTAYLTYQPKSSRSDAMLEKRKQCYLDGKGTSHWANKCEIKTYPYGFKTNYLNRNIKQIDPTVIVDGDISTIPPDRLGLL